MPHYLFLLKLCREGFLFAFRSYCFTKPQSSKVWFSLSVDSNAELSINIEGTTDSGLVLSQE